MLWIVMEEPHERATEAQKDAFNDSTQMNAPNPTDCTIGEIFSRQVARNPEAVALEDGDAKLTYGELAQRSNDLASTLKQEGIASRQRVGVYLDRSIDFVVSVLAVLKVGASYVPLPKDYPMERISFIIRDAEIGAVLSSGAIPEFAGEPGLVAIDPTKETIPSDFAPPGDGATKTSGDDPAYIMYTSGSTGIPKGVIIPHRGVIRLVKEQVYAKFTPEAKFLFLSAPAFDASTFEIWGALLNGGTCVIHSNRYLDLDELKKTIRQHKVTTTWLTSGLFNAIIDTDPSVIETVEHVLTGGEALSPSHVTKALQTFPKLRLTNGYGPTECTTFALTHEIGSGDIERDTIPIGKPINNTKAYILDKDRQPVRPGNEGELYLGGAGLAIGYLNQPELNADKFIPDPLSATEETNLYRTGDRVRLLDDGVLEFLGREDALIKIRGFRIELGEIETALSKHSQILQAAANPIRNDEGTVISIRAYFVSKQKFPIPSENELKEFLRTQLPGYAIPDRFIHIPEIPLTANGKVDRDALANFHSERMIPPTRTEPPGTPEEEALARIWKDLLGLDAIGPDDDFFSLGGESLLATQLVSRIRSQFKRKVTVADLFTNPTLIEMSSNISTAENLQESVKAPNGTKAGPNRFPLSYSQEGLWFTNAMEEGLLRNNIADGLSLEGALDKASLIRAIEFLVARHESFRLRFDVEDGLPVQYLTEDPGKIFERTDFCEIGVHNREQRLKEHLRNAQEQAFDIKNGPIFKFHLIKLSEDRHLLFWVCHHIVADGWSFSLLKHEIGVCYSAYSKGREPELSELKLQYSDFCLWQRETLRGNELERQANYWTKQLQNAPQLALHTDQPATARSTFAGKEHRFKIPTELSGQIAKYNKEEKITPYISLMAAFQVLLFRYTAQTDIVTGTPIANRQQEEFERVMGLFVNTLVMRLDLSGSPNFTEVIRRFKEVTLAAHSHQDLAFSKLVEHLNPPRQVNRHPIFQVAMAVQDMPFPAPAFKDLIVLDYPVSEVMTQFDLELHLRNEGGCWQGKFIYRKDLFKAGTIERMASHFCNLLDNLLNSPQQPVSEVNLLCEEEREEILKEWSNVGPPPAPIKDTAHSIFEQQVSVSKHAPALVEDSRTITYEQLDHHANLLATRLLESGVESGQMVGIYLDRSIEFIVSLLAVMKVGGIYVPLATDYPESRLRFMVKDAGIQMVLAKDSLPEWMQEDGIQHLDPANVRSDPLAGTEFKSMPGGGDSPAYLMYTSGSTGNPKGVLIPHRGIIRLVKEQAYAEFGQERRFLFHSSPSFDASTFEIWGPLLNGGTCVVSDKRHPSLHDLKETICRHHVSTIFLTTGLFNLLVDTLPEALETVDHVLTGGEALSPSHAQKVLEKFPGIRLTNCYGPTECTTFALTHDITAEDQSIDSAPLGMPIGNTEAYILDRSGHPVPAGVPGELCLGGQGLALEYHNNAETTSEKFVDHPFSEDPDLRLYRTGDLCRYRETGFLEFIGRVDRQVKIRGFRVEMGEIESAMKAYPGISQSVAVSKRPTGESISIVMYFTAMDSTETPLAEELRLFMAQRVPDYSIPSAFVQLDALPLTPNGKIDLEALPEPDYLSVDKNDSTIITGSKEEEELLRIWRKILGIENIGLHDNFFALGGHSLLATKMIAAIEQELGVRLPIASLFEAPTVEGLAKNVAAKSASNKDKSLVKLQTEGSLSPLFCLHGMRGDLYAFVDLAKHLGPERPVYGLQALGWEEGAPIHTSVEEMAEHYASEILAIKHSGPYNLLGFSAGGWVAFAVAQKLRQRGHSINLYMYDTHFLTAQVPYLAYAVGRCLDLLEWIPHHVARFLQQPRGEKLAYIRNRLDWFSKMLPSKQSETFAGRTRKSPKEEDLSNDYFIKVISQFTPATYSGGLTLLSDSKVKTYKLNLWRFLIRGKLEVHYVGGGHTGIFDPNYVRIIANLFRKLLSRHDNV
ncbi:MAG: amino acid adenylation domain-containing protein [Puniceicoccaceae bacterium]